MRVEIDKAHTVAFENLLVGHTFSFSGNDYIKVNQNEMLGRAVRLQDGYVGKFAANTLIVPTPNSCFYRHVEK